MNCFIRYFCSVLLLLLADLVHAEMIEGEWATEGYGARVQIARCTQAMNRWCGKIEWLWHSVDQDGNPLRDKYNSNAANKTRPLIGLSLLEGFREGKTNEWNDGTIYDPESGRTYKSTLLLRNATTLEVSGCILFVCRKQIWYRVEAVYPFVK
jgi:uncharacterized protein (DUF2147 family)